MRQFGDGNPGATNVFRAGGKFVGLLALLLDISKAAAPVGLAYHNLNIRGAPMLLIALAPVFGHAFSPFLGFRGGKALAAALGVWIGLTIWKASLPGVIAALIGILLVIPPGWSVMFALGGILIGLLIWLPDPLLFWVWIIETLLLVWTHRTDLSHTPQFRQWFVNFLGRGNS